MEMKITRFLIFLSAFFATAEVAMPQSIGINTTGAAPTTPSMLEVLQSGTTANSIGIYSLHLGAISGTGYSGYFSKTGASTTNIGGYFSAAGATNNYAGIFENGQVGIGTTAPTYPLHIYSNTGGSGTEATIETGTTNWAGIAVKNANRKYFAGIPSGGTDRFAIVDNTAGIERVSLLSNGYVGVGTSPNDKFEVLPSGGRGVVLGGGATTGSEIKFTYSGTQHFSIYNSGNSKLSFAQTSSLYQTNTSGTVLGTFDDDGDFSVTRSIQAGSISSEPSGSNGMIYYNSSTGKFRGYENGTWKDLIGTGSGGTAYKIYSSLHPSNDDIAGWTTSLSSCVDDAAYTVSWGFNLKINGTNYTQGWISSNGIFGLGTNTSSSYSNGSLPTAISSDPMLFFHWDDNSANLIRYVVLGTSPSRICYIHWLGSETLSCTGGASQIEAYITIHESSNVVSVRYKTVGSNGDTQGASATFGFQFSGGGSASTIPLGYDSKLLDDNSAPQEFSIDFGQ